MTKGQLDPAIRRAIAQGTVGLSAAHLDSIETGLLLMRTARDAYALLDRHFARYGLSQGRFALLMQLSLHGGELCPCELAARTNVSRATVTGLLIGLERAGLVERVDRRGDRRLRAVRLTAAGEACLKNLLPDHFRRLADLLADLTPAERQCLQAILAKIDRRAASLR